jgi:3-oxoacyl-[acyl-carrier protein] reductase
MHPDIDAVAIVTGGSRGIGREVVRMLARRRYAIVVVYLDDQARAEDTVDEVFAADSMAVTVRADVTDDLDVERLFDEAIAVFGGVDAIVHTATRGGSVLYQHAAGRLRPGSAIVSVAADQVAPAVTEQLRQRDITVVGFADGAAADLVALLDRWRHRLAC